MPKKLLKIGKPKPGSEGECLDVLGESVSVVKSLEELKSKLDSYSTQGSESLVILRDILAKYEGLMEYSIAQTQVYTLLYQKVVAIGPFLKELSTELDLSEEDEKLIDELMLKYGLKDSEKAVTWQ